MPTGNNNADGKDASDGDDDDDNDGDDDFRETFMMRR